MSFFEEMPAAEPDPEETRQPEWAGPPDNVMGVTVPFDLMLANTGRVAVVIGGMTAYPNGVAFEVRILRREPGRDDALWRMHHPGPGGFRLGVELPDGGRAVLDSPPGEAPTLTSSGGRGGGLSYTMSFWLWPLPAAGALRFACEWPDEDIEESIAELDAPIRAAAARSVELWPDDRPVS